MNYKQRNEFTLIFCTRFLCVRHIFPNFSKEKKTRSASIKHFYALQYFIHYAISFGPLSSLIRHMDVHILTLRLAQHYIRSFRIFLLLPVRWPAAFCPICVYRYLQCVSLPCKACLISTVFHQFFLFLMEYSSVSTTFVSSPKISSKWLQPLKEHENNRTWVRKSVRGDFHHLGEPAIGTHRCNK